MKLLSSSSMGAFSRDYSNISVKCSCEMGTSSVDYQPSHHLKLTLVIISAKNVECIAGQFTGS